jgi:hypothetical protein
MGDDPMALLGLEGALKHYYYYYLSGQDSPRDANGSCVRRPCTRQNGTAGLDRDSLFEQVKPVLVPHQCLTASKFVRDFGMLCMFP